MNTTRHLMVTSVVTALLVGNVLPVMGAALGAMGWEEVTRNWLGINLSFVIPGALAMLPAAWISGHDPDIESGSPLLLAAGVVVLACCAFFVLMLAWIPLLPWALQLLAAEGVDLPHFPEGVAQTLFLALVVALVAAVPIWLVETGVVHWLQRRMRASSQGSIA